MLTVSEPALVRNEKGQREPIIIRVLCFTCVHGASCSFDKIFVQAHFFT
jgi:hypothetical protein